MQDQTQERRTVLNEKTTLNIDGHLLKDVIKNLTDLLDTYGDKAQISEEQYEYNDDRSYLALLVPEPETDTQMQARIKQENYYKDLREQQERKEFERLAVKFANKQE